MDNTSREVDIFLRHRKEELNEEKNKQVVLPEEYEFNLSDFALFLVVMKNRKAYQNTLSIILDEQDLELTQVKVEQVILNKSGKKTKYKELPCTTIIFITQEDIFGEDWS